MILRKCRANYEELTSLINNGWRRKPSSRWAAPIYPLSGRRIWLCVWFTFYVWRRHWSPSIISENFKFRWNLAFKPGSWHPPKWYDQWIWSFSASHTGELKSGCFLVGRTYLSNRNALLLPQSPLYWNPHSLHWLGQQSKTKIHQWSLLCAVSPQKTWMQCDKMISEKETGNISYWDMFPASFYFLSILYKIKLLSSNCTSATSCSWYPFSSSLPLVSSYCKKTQQSSKFSIKSTSV